ncbi:MAG: TatD family hydrolase [Candidatus Altiarchaeota archaeon]|nr:TatD family hydrolase [Candidatus Altiarchaeota archaeon]
MIDVHAHMQSAEFKADLKTVLLRAKTTGVRAIICNSTSFDDSIECLELSRTFSDIFPAIGLYPAEDASQLEAVLNLIETSPDIVAVGEIGLDYRYGKDLAQIEIFRKQLELAKEMGLPVIVHSRSAGKYVLEILEAMEMDKVVLHSFDGSVKLVPRIIELGFYVSIPVTVVKSKQKQELATLMPVDKLLLESDSPVLNPFDGRNEPANILHSLKAIAELRGIGPKELETQTDRNAIKLFELRI